MQMITVYFRRSIFCSNMQLSYIVSIVRLSYESSLRLIQKSAVPIAELWPWIRCWIKAPAMGSFH
jgi:hypothetical protein